MRDLQASGSAAASWTAVSYGCGASLMAARTRWGIMGRELLHLGEHLGAWCAARDERFKLLVVPNLVSRQLRRRSSTLFLSPERRRCLEGAMLSP
jgi:hypothetical protein